LPQQRRGRGPNRLNFARGKFGLNVQCVAQTVNGIVGLVPEAR
jgi:hypothetical protein